MGNLTNADKTSIMHDTGFFCQKFKLISTAEFKYLGKGEIMEAYQDEDLMK